MLSLTTSPSTRMSNRFGAFLGVARAWPAKVRQLYSQNVEPGAEINETDLARSQAVYEGLKDLELLDAIQVMNGSSLAYHPPTAVPQPGERAAMDLLQSKLPAALLAARGNPVGSTLTTYYGGKIGGQFCSHPTYSPDTANLCLERIAQVWGAVYEAGGPAPYCRVDNPMTCGEDPRKYMPAAGKRFQKTGSLLNPGVEGVDLQVLSFPVPDAWDGVLITITNQWDGAGFVDGSGDLIWRLMIDNQWLKDLDDVRITLGRLENPYELEGAGYYLQSHQQVRYFVRLGPGALARLAPTGRITCACSGWFYPRS